MARETKNPVELDGCDDMSNLIYLNDSDVSYNLQHRFNNCKPYTSISEILIAVNPYKLYDIYGGKYIKLIRDYVQNGTGNKPKPHVYNLAAIAYNNIKVYNKNQSLLVCGESGAGKTENSKRLMEYLTYNENSNDKSSLDKQILDCNPILEAFGNAKTIMNNNSSRFGKFTKLLYSNNNNNNPLLIGAEIDTYLLEKSRVVMQNKYERNYHSFFLVFMGASKKYDSLGLDPSDIKSYKYLYGNNNHSEHILRIKNKNDISDFKEVEQSFNSININSDKQLLIWNIVSAILHLGNINFEQINDSSEGSKITSLSNKHLEYAYELLGLENKELLIKRLTTRTIKVGLEQIESPLNISDSIDNRNSISKILYSKLFDWIVNACNIVLSNNNSNDCNNFIGILDIFGFECFETNSFEQFCINFANEVLQEHFNKSIISSEQEEYLKEGLPWKELECPNNELILKLISGKPNGILIQLDSACNMPKGNSSIFLSNLTKYNSKNIKFKKGNVLNKKLNKSKNYNAFTVYHYAQIVVYDCNEFLVKNTDSIHPDTIKLFNNSNNDILKQIFSKLNKKKKGGSFNSVGNLFNKQVNKLMNDLNLTRPYFIRCINPNKNKSSTEWDKQHMLKQLKCNGVIEALKVLKLGYPNRSEYKFILDKFSNFMNNNETLSQLDERQKIKCILIGLNIKSNEYELGFTKVFFKPSNNNYMEIIQKHNGTFDDNCLNNMLRYAKLSKLPRICGLINCYTKLYFLLTKKKAKEELNNYINQMAFISKFKGIVLRIKNNQSEAEPELQSEQLQTLAKNETDISKQQISNNSTNYSDDESDVSSIHSDDSEQIKKLKMKLKKYQTKVRKHIKRVSNALQKEDLQMEQNEDETQQTSDEEYNEDSEEEEEESGEYSEEEESEEYSEEEESEEYSDDEEEESEMMISDALRMKLNRLSQVWTIPSTQGESFSKHGRQGMPHKRIVKVSSDGSMISYGRKSEQKLSLLNCKGIKRGKTTAVWKKAANAKVDENFCFSIVWKDRTLDLEAFNRGQRNVWLAGLSALTGPYRKEFVKMRKNVIKQKTKTLK